MSTKGIALLGRQVSSYPGRLVMCDAQLCVCAEESSDCTVPAAPHAYEDEKHEERDEWDPPPAPQA